MASEEYKKDFKQLLYREETQKDFLEELTKMISDGEYEKVKGLVDLLKDGNKMGLLVHQNEGKEETVLHTAAKCHQSGVIERCNQSSDIERCNQSSNIERCNQSSNIIRCLIRECPGLMKATRIKNEDYCGQSPLHIAITKGDVNVVDIMIPKKLKQDKSILHTLATGRKFVNTVMMGELPLTVACLTFNTNMIDILLHKGAEMDRVNSQGDTLFHSLIRYAALYPEHTDNVHATLEHLNPKIKKNEVKIDKPKKLNMDYCHGDNTYIWFISNNEDMNPLQLAASLSQPDIFKFILHHTHAYCVHNDHDGLFDQKSYDITEIDTTATEKWALNQRLHRNKRLTAPSYIDGVSKRSYTNTKVSGLPQDVCSSCMKEQSKSILEIMFSIKRTSAFEFIQMSILRQIIETKWIYYRNIYYGWMLFHVLFMVILTVFSIQQADHDDEEKTNRELEKNSSVKMEDNLTRARFIQGWQFVYLVTALFYLFQEVWHLFFRNNAFHVIHMTNILHNMSYRLILFLFSASLVIEFILDNVMETYENVALIVSLITGWWFVVFFLRAQKKFSFFTVMIQKVIFGDLLRFSIIIMLVLVSFTAAMYMNFKGVETDDLQRRSYFGMMMLLFQLMLGLGEIEELYNAKQPWLAVTLYVIFVLLTYVLMFNALIAMMSQTCTLVSENRHVQSKVQQLSVILFFEEILPSRLQKCVGDERSVKRYDPIMKQVVDEKRYFLDISSLHTKYPPKHKLQADDNMDKPHGTVKQKRKKSTKVLNVAQLPEVQINNPARVHKDCSLDITNHSNM